MMSWSGRRRTLIITVIVAIFCAIIAIVLIPFFYHTPSCSDGIQNQNETGIDCGGSCAYICKAQAQSPTVQFVSALANIGTRIDVVAYIDNANADASVKNAKYTIELYGPNAILVAKYSGAIDLPPHSTVPIFIPNIYSGKQKVINVFLTFDTESIKWFKSTVTPTVLPVSNIQVIGTTSPRITATLTNPTGVDLFNVKAIIAVFDKSNNVIAASQTIVPEIPAEESSEMVFTWNLPFAGIPAKEEVWPILPVTAP